MKILNFKIVLILLLIFSLSLNVYFIYNKKFKQEAENNNSCLTMYGDYYLNTPKDNSLDFDENYTKQCLKETFSKTFYFYDGITERILNDLKKYKGKKGDIPEFYKKILKEKFYIKANENIDYSSIKLALDLIGDNDFKNSKIVKEIFSKK